tara:strand:- start:722 stop:1264 length:543 start_codon:yes stop_codon:yes gene_type:complete
MIFLEDEDINLRPLDVSDAEGDYPTWLNDKATSMGNRHHRLPYSRVNAIHFIKSIGDASDSIVLAIINKKNKKHVGNISLQDICWISRSAELAVMIGDSAGRNRGIGYRASKLIVTHGFTALNLHSIRCKTFATNDAMIRLAKKLGMNHVGSLRESEFKNGRYLGVEIFDLLKKDWPIQP